MYLNDQKLGKTEHFCWVLIVLHIKQTSKNLTIDITTYLFSMSLRWHYTFTVGIPMVKVHV